LSIDTGLVYNPTTNVVSASNNLCVGTTTPATYLGTNKKGIAIYNTTFPSFAIADAAGSFLIQKGSNTNLNIIGIGNAASGYFYFTNVNLSVGGLIEVAGSAQIGGQLISQAGRKIHRRVVIANPCTKTTDTILAIDHHVIIDTNAGALTANLPAGIAETEYVIYNAGFGCTNSVTIHPATSEYLFGTTDNYTLVYGKTARIVYDGTIGWVGSIG
jgi:hypothetical protein